MSSSDRATGLSGATWGCGSISGTASRAVVRSRTSVSDDMGRLPDGSWQFFPVYVLQRPAKITKDPPRRRLGTRPRFRPSAVRFLEALAPETRCAWPVVVRGPAARRLARVVL